MRTNHSNSPDYHDERQPYRGAELPQCYVARRLLVVNKHFVNQCYTAHLKKRIGEEKDRERNKVLLVGDVQVFSHIIQLRQHSRSQVESGKVCIASTHAFALPMFPRSRKFNR